jgi:hypothetical protein
MKRMVMLSLGAILFASVCFGQDSTAAGTPAATSHGSFPTQVSKTLDSSKLKDGDPVEVEIAGSFRLADGTLVPKGSKLEGHVTSAKARSKGDADSELTLTFEKLDLQGGKQLTVKGIVQSIFPPADEPQGPNMATAGTSNGGSAGGANPGAVNSGGIGITQSKTGSSMQSDSSGQVATDVKAAGVQGMHDLQLENGVVTSKGKNVKLGIGVRLVVKADIFG